ncbi:ester cyclase [Jiangella asiatica]|uniref:Ester cyclase n=1 Tax=Jiangella asiatica TaxID=2530372 RepID=A0A4R5DRY1_9ACTN|nr:ester cyclase [Jiangella asiatica]TDE15084.1 ester cyclase [Jiangella asiatica]
MGSKEKDVVRRFYEIIGEGRPEALDEVCASDLVGHAGAGSNLADLKASIASYVAPFPDLAAEVRHLVQEGNLVCVWLSYTATHRAEFAGVPASGRHVKFAAWDLIRVQDGKIVEITQYCDLFTIMGQIGALPTAAPA